MRKKGYYLYTEKCGSSGVNNKIRMQISTFSEKVDIKGVQIENCPRNLLKRIWGLFLWGSFARDYEKALREIKSPDFIYIRRWYIDKRQLEFLKAIKEKYPLCKIIVEIPTYPYFKEFCSNVYSILALFKEIMYMGKNKLYIDRFVTYSNDEKIFGIPTIRTMNGIDTKSITSSFNDTKYTGKEIHLVAVALFARHHGYERIIKGLYEYYMSPRKCTIFFHVVGTGSELPKYEKMVRKCHLEKYVLFYGERSGEALDAIYCKADIGVAALGVYKDGLSKLSTLKAREYMAKGLPVILGAEDDLFTQCKYGLFFPNDRTPIKMERVVNFACDLFEGKDRRVLASEIRNYVEKNADNCVTLKPIIDYIYSD